MKHYGVALKSLNGGLWVLDADRFQIEDGLAVFYTKDESGIPQPTHVVAQGEWNYFGIVSDEQLADMNKRKEAK